MQPTENQLRLKEALLLLVERDAQGLTPREKWEALVAAADEWQERNAPNDTDE